MVAVVEEAQRASARCGVVDDLGHHRVVQAKVELVADANLACRLNEHIPQLVIGIELTQEEDLDARTGLLLVAKEFGGEDLGIIEHKQVMRVEILKDILENAVLDLVAALVQDHEAGLVAHGRGIGSDELLGHLGIEF